jgi:hypothetical protein
LRGSSELVRSTLRSFVRAVARFRDGNKGAIRPKPNGGLPPSDYAKREGLRTMVVRPIVCRACRHSCGVHITLHAPGREQRLGRGRGTAGLPEIQWDGYLPMVRMHTSRARDRCRTWQKPLMNARCAVTAQAVRKLIGSGHYLHPHSAWSIRPSASPLTKRSGIDSDLPEGGQCSVKPPIEVDGRLTGPTETSEQEKIPDFGMK